MLFLDRQDAGEKLARRLTMYRDQQPFVIALPRGGVVVGFEVAKALNAPLDVMVVRKLGAPAQPELGIGAVGPQGVRVLNRELVRLLGVTDEELESVTRRETREMERRLRHFRGDAPMPNLEDRTVILVDDGLATGITARAAIRALRQMNPAKVILAVPVAAPDTVESLRLDVEGLLALEIPEPFNSVGSWYRQFPQTSDEEVIRLLERGRQRSFV